MRELSFRNKQVYKQRRQNYTNTVTFYSYQIHLGKSRFAYQFISKQERMGETSKMKSNQASNTRN